MVDFSLSDHFLENYKSKKPNFGFNGLGELVYRRTYSRLKEDGSKEEWWETVKRVVEGCYNMQKRHVDRYNLGWNPWKAQRSAQEMYDRIFTFKFLPPGRGLWAMGSPITEERGINLALVNCAFSSTEFIDKEYSLPFAYVMDVSMLGVGSGFDSRGKGKLVIQEPEGEVEVFVIPDSREGWVESLQRLLDSYFKGTNPVQFDYTEIRPEGAPIKGFGGVSSGYKPLKKMHDSITEVLATSVGKPITARIITDIMNFIGKCVVSGNVRRTALLGLGEADDEEFLDLKDYSKNPERAEYGWTSNNSVFGKTGMDYSAIADRTRINGEPGFFWLENARNYGRLVDGRQPGIDSEIMGVNPCGEIGLEHMGICNLVETFPNHHENLEDFKKTLKYAYLYSKTVTLGNTHWVGTNRVILRNRRIGCSVSGIAQFLSDKGIDNLRTWLDEGYGEIRRLDDTYSNWLAIPKSIKVSTVKPSGSTSLLCGVTPGIHFPESKYYIRRMRLSKNSDLIPALREAGYTLEPAVGSEEDTVVVEIPVFVGENVRTNGDVSIWEQMNVAELLQTYWADNQVSMTVSYDPETEGHEIENVLNYYQYKLKSISFLPRTGAGAYPQMPYEKITKEKYEEMVQQLKSVDFSLDVLDAVPEKYCDGEACVL